MLFKDILANKVDYRTQMGDITKLQRLIAQTPIFAQFYLGTTLSPFKLQQNLTVILYPCCKY